MRVSQIQTAARGLKNHSNVTSSKNVEKGISLGARDSLFTLKARQPTSQPGFSHPPISVVNNHKSFPLAYRPTSKRAKRQGGSVF